MSENYLQEVMTPEPQNVFSGPWTETDRDLLYTQLPPVGTCVKARDGREFVFCRFQANSGADVGIGEYVASGITADVDGNDAFDVKVDTVGANAIGDTAVTIVTQGLDLEGAGAGIISKNFFAGGYLQIAAQQQRLIVSSTAGTGSVDIILTLDEGLKAAALTGADAYVTRSLFNNVRQGTADDLICGVSLVAVTPESNARAEYSWVQTKGIAGVKIGVVTSVVKGARLKPAAAGKAVVSAAVTDQNGGIALATPSTADDLIPVCLG